MKNLKRISTLLLISLSLASTNIYSSGRNTPTGDGQSSLLSVDLGDNTASSPGEDSFSSPREIGSRSAAAGRFFSRLTNGANPGFVNEWVYSKTENHPRIQKALKIVHPAHALLVVVVGVALVFADRAINNGEMSTGAKNFGYNVGAMAGRGAKFGANKLGLLIKLLGEKIENATKTASRVLGVEEKNKEEELSEEAGE